MARTRPAAMRGKAGAGLLRQLLACLLLSLAGTAAAQRPPLTVPTQADVVVERLPRGYAALVPGRVSPQPLENAGRLLALAARTGDLRLAARADALLQRLPTDSTDPAVWRLRAFAAQHRHDFATATRALERAIALAPRDADARLALASIHLVQGDLRRARAGCAALVLGIDAQAGGLCVASLALRTGDTTAAANAVDRWLAAAGADVDAEPVRHARVLRAEIAARAGDRKADAWFARALALAPDDVRTRSAYVRHLAASGRHAEALALIGESPETDGLALQQALSARALARADAATLRDALARRFARQRALGAVPERRDEADYLLALRGDADAALILAQANFAEQKDVEDVDLLWRAATAAGRPQAFAGARRWAREQGLALKRETTP